jgi:Asparagine synthase
MFAAVLASDQLVAEVGRRAEQLRRFYALELVALTQPAPRVVVGVLGGQDELGPSAGTLVWGEPLTDDVRLIDAGDDELRSICGVSAAIAWRDGQLRIVNNAAGPATLYSADGDGVAAYATHAVAAAAIAGLTPRVDEAAVPEFIALDYVGGERTLVAGVRTVAPGSDVGVDGVRSYWPARERWAHVADPYEHTEQALMSTLRSRVGNARVGLALTGGLDSTVGAAALHELGANTLAFTWGNPDWPDALGAARTAEHLGIEHEVYGARMLPDGACLRALDHDVRWSDGMTALSAAERQWPQSCEVLAVGMGAETGRAFYYDAWSALMVPRPTSDELARRLGAHGRLRGASDDARRALASTVLGWVEEAKQLGANGWDALDILYTEQRVRRWGRSQIPPLDQDLVLLFTSAEVSRGLASLPLRDRLRDGFHRRFLAARGFDPGSPELPDPGRLSLATRRLRRRLRRRAAVQPQPDDVDLLVKHVWAQRPLAREWVCDEALTDPLITGTLGSAWGAATAEGFREGRAHTSERALRAAGVVGFARALEALK